MDIGVPELLIIMVILVLIMGPSKLAGLGGSLGKSIREFRTALKPEDELDQPSQPTIASQSTPAGGATQTTSMTVPVSGDNKSKT